MGTRWQDKTVVITGASAGVGKACAEAFAREQANLVLVARNSKPLKEVASDLSDLTRVLVVPMDVADTTECTNLFRKAEFEFGNIHVLVNNAGYHARGPVERIECADLSAMVDVNLRAPIVLSKLVLPYLRAAGVGAIVNIASLAGCTPVRDAATYSATKFGLRAFSMSLADELRGSGVHVGLVSPGPIDTGFIMDEIDEVADIVFSQPMSTANEVADAILAVAAGERFEKKMPRISGPLTTVSYLFPALRRLLVPVMEKRGRKAKAYYRDRNKRQK